MAVETSGDAGEMPAVEDEAASSTRLYVAFEGGGAKGIVHVGALRAIEERGFSVCGVSGTSAGAIIAALKAVGYTGAEMVDLDTRNTILDGVVGVNGKPLRSTDLFGPGGWRRVSWLRRSIDSSRRLRPIHAVAALLVLVIAMPAVAAAHQSLAVAVVLILAVGALAALGMAAWLLSGLAQLDYFARKLDEVLSARFSEVPLGRPLTFGDLRERDEVCLKIVATDLTSGTLRLFSSEAPSDWHVPVAHAVAASICLPVIFKPWPIESRRYLDGGLVSNLPVWPFDERRLLDPDAKTVAVEIDDPAGFASDPTSSLLWPPRLLRTAIFGAGVLNKRAVPDLCVIRLRTTLGLLEFDSPRDRYLREVQRAQGAADVQIMRQIRDVPRLFRNASERLHPIILKLLAISSLLPDDDPSELRIAIAQADRGHYRSMRLTHGFGFENDMDEGLIFSDELNCEPLTSEPLYSDSSLLLWRSAGDPPFADKLFPRPEDRWSRKKFRPDVNWILTVPVLSSNSGESDGIMNSRPPSFVVHIDGSAALTGDAAEIQAFHELAIEQVEAIYSAIADDERITRYAEHK